MNQSIHALGRCLSCGSYEIEKTKVKLGPRPLHYAAGILCVLAVLSAFAGDSGAAFVILLIAAVTASVGGDTSPNRNRCKGCGYIWKP